MTDLTPADRDVSRAIRSWLHEDRHEDASRIAGAVLDQVEATPRRRAGWPAWRTPTMNRTITFGLGAAAVVLIGAFLGAQLLGSPGNTGTGGPTATAQTTGTPEPSVAEATSTPAAFEPREVVVSESDSPVQVTVTTTAPGWTPLAGLGAITKNDDGLDPPESEGIALIAWSWPAGTGFQVYEDPCSWSTTVPEQPATTWREIVDALEAQAETEFVGASGPPPHPGIDGVHVGLQVPMTYEVPGATREEEFAACDQSIYGFYGVEGEAEPARNAQGPGQIDELWILDVEGMIVILDLAYGPATPAELVEEAIAMAESATFEIR